MKSSNLKYYILLHVLLMVYSISGILSKLAAKVVFMSIPFILLYLGLVFLLGIYAIFWQQIIKALPLTIAYANKAVSVIWGLVWGILFFHEKLTLGKLIGICLIVTGIILFCKSDENLENNKYEQ